MLSNIRSMTAAKALQIVRRPRLAKQRGALPVTESGLGRSVLRRSERLVRFRLALAIATDLIAVTASLGRAPAGAPVFRMVEVAPIAGVVGAEFEAGPGALEHCRVHRGQNRAECRVGSRCGRAQATTASGGVELERQLRALARVGHGGSVARARYPVVRARHRAQVLTQLTRAQRLFGRRNAASPDQRRFAQPLRKGVRRGERVRTARTVDRIEEVADQFELPGRGRPNEFELAGHERELGCLHARIITPVNQIDKLR